MIILIIFIVHRTFIMGCECYRIPIFQFFYSLCHGDFRTIWAQGRSSQVHHSPDVTAQTFTGLDYNHKPIWLVLVFADCENRKHNQMIISSIRHPKNWSEQCDSQRQKKQSLIVGLFSFFLAHLVYKMYFLIGQKISQNLMFLQLILPNTELATSSCVAGKKQ